MPVPELLLIDKPAEMTSFDVIRALRAKTGVKKFGHAGTLDPAATGLLVIGVGPGTKQLSRLTKLDKEYEATVFLGVATTTSDRDGEVVRSKPVVLTTELKKQIVKTVGSLVGETELPVSAYSAIKRDGVPMYKRARAAAARGEMIDDLPVRVMYVYEVEVINMYPETFQNQNGIALQTRFFVASGTYIRSLAEEIGRQLGLPACLTALRRTRVGDYSITDAKQLDEVK